MFYENPHRFREIRIPPAAVGRVRPNDYETCGSKVPSPHLLKGPHVIALFSIYPYGSISLPCFYFGRRDLFYFVSEHAFMQSH